MGADTHGFIQQRAPFVWQSHHGTGASEVCDPFSSVPLKESVSDWVCLVQGVDLCGLVNFVSLSACSNAVHLLAWSGKKTLQTLLVWDESWLYSLCF